MCNVRRSPFAVRRGGSSASGQRPTANLFLLAVLLALAVAWVVQPDLLVRLSVVPRFLAAVAVAFVPIFLANLVFAKRFRDVVLTPLFRARSACVIAAPSGA